MEKKYIYRLFVVTVCLLCSVSTFCQEAYAVYRSDYTRLTFYYDDLRATRGGTSYDLNTGSVNPGWYLDGTMSSVTRVVFNPSFADALPTSTFGWFYGMENLQSISDIKYLNTSNVEDMTNMFRLCSKLTSLDVSHFNTENVTSMANMFWQCKGITTLDVSGFVTDNVTSMKNMFIYCENLKNLDVSNFNTSNVTNTSGMFESCSALTTIYVGIGWSTTAVTVSNTMFLNCNNLVGGQGTTYDANCIDATYAHIDGGPNNPGYFTAKDSSSLRGDVNGDNEVNIADVTALIDYLLSQDSSYINVDNADVYQDQEVNIADVTALIDYLLSGTWN